MDLRPCVYVILLFVTAEALDDPENDIIFPESSSEEETCRTPDQQVGSCISYKSCKPMNDFLALIPDLISPDMVRLLKPLLVSYKCGTSKVCCPSKPIVFEGITETRFRETQIGPPDVSTHRNLGFLSENCGEIDTGKRIVHGNQTGLFDFPWMALLSYRTSAGAKFKCGGTIINERYILTAAHCITNLKSPLIGVRVGEHNIKTEPDCELNESGESICALPHQDLAIEEVIPHPQYQITPYSNDIGLLRVAKIRFNNDSVKPICLPLEKSRTKPVREGVVTGWGATEKGPSSSKLLKAELPAVANEECARIYNKTVKINSRQLCAGGKTKADSCNGDSGGPLQVLLNQHGDSRLVQQGIVSFGPRDCGQTALGRGKPGVYTRVAYYMDWILDNMRN